MKPVVYDSGVLIAADRGERQVWVEHKLLIASGFVPLVPSLVVAQTSRSPKQVQMRRLLRGCRITSFGEAEAHRVGTLLGASKTRDIVDAAVVVVAIEQGANVRTSDGSDIRHLIAAARVDIDVLDL